MTPHRIYDYAIVRVVPRVDRGEFVNAGIILSCDIERILRARIELDEGAVLALDCRADLVSIREALAVIPVLCAGGPGSGPIGAMTERERFHWLVSPKSTIVQVSPVHTGRCRDIEAALEHLVATLVRR